jgi:hypothetical protein
LLQTDFGEAERSNHGISTLVVIIIIVVPQDRVVAGDADQDSKTEHQRTNGCSHDDFSASHVDLRQTSARD